MTSVGVSVVEKREGHKVPPSGLLKNLFFQDTNKQTSGISAQALGGHPYAPPSWYYRLPHCVTSSVDANVASLDVPWLQYKRMVPRIAPRFYEA